MCGKKLGQLEYLLSQQKGKPFWLNLKERKLKKNSECVKKKVRVKLELFTFSKGKKANFG